MTRTYSELMSLPTFMERFNYLKLDGFVGKETFGFDRYLNQDFYNSYEWRKLRRDVIIRDNGCDLAVPDREIYGRVIVHHLNPINLNDILDFSNYLMNPEYLITVSSFTHNAIHFGDSELVDRDPIVRRPNDTCPWKEARYV